MMRKNLLFSGATPFLAILAAGVAAPAFAQDGGVEETVITGSFIRGTPEDAALPVDVLTERELENQGSPTLVELIRNFDVSTGQDSETNQFASNGLEGTANINLRGLGAARTLVLINGKRQVFSPYAIGEQAQLFVDINQIPQAAIGRVEVLKDGAAALYGSDAIAGVVNFITRSNFEGFEIGGEYQTFEGSDGEYNVNASYGLQGENLSWVTSVGYNKRSEVLLLDKDWAVLPFSENPVGGWSGIGQPGAFLPLGATGAPAGGSRPDAGCLDVGATFVAGCRFQFTQFDNLVEEEERYQVFSELNFGVGDGHNVHLEALYAYTDVPEWKTSPSYPPQVLTSQFVPVSHPGLQAYVGDFPSEAILGAGAGALFIGRSFGWGGYPGTGGGPQEGFRTHETLRFSGGIDGELREGVNYEVSLGWSQSNGQRSTNDTYIIGLQAALRGFGICTDPNTGFDPATGTRPFAAGYTGALRAGQGACQYYNPFSNAIAANAITGQTNPNHESRLANSPELADWLTDASFTDVTADLLVFDAILNGTTNVSTPAGAVGWAAGVQVRREGYKVEPSALTDLAVTPGPGGTGPFSFLAGTNRFDENQTIWAAFSEFQIPLSEKLDVQVAMRYEDYGDEVGSTFDPKIAAKWQATDSFALRGSAQTSFRGPTLNQLSGQVTTLQFVAPTSAFKAVDQVGNPDLDPETAFSFNFGALFQRGGFSASLDYWDFSFDKPIIVEEQAQIVNAAIAAIATPSTADDAILSRITFQGAPTAANIARIRTEVVNGPSIETSGFDLRVENVWDSAFGGELTLGAEGAYILEYVVDSYFVEGVEIKGGDYVGQFNRTNFTRSRPQWKGNLFANYANGRHNVRAVVRHTDSYEDERGKVGPTGAFTPTTSASFVPFDISSQTTIDLFYNLDLPWQSRLGLSVVNVTDEDPPFAQFDVNYDPYTHNPFGRVTKISLTKKFGG